MYMYMRFKFPEEINNFSYISLISSSPINPSPVTILVLERKIAKQIAGLQNSSFDYQMRYKLEQIEFLYYKHTWT